MFVNITQSDLIRVMPILVVGFRLPKRVISPLSALERSVTKFLTQLFSVDRVIEHIPDYF